MAAVELTHWRTEQILHRDLEPKHIGFDVYNNLCVIDLGSATNLDPDHGSTLSGYRGMKLSGGGAHIMHDTFVQYVAMSFTKGLWCVHRKMC